MSELDQIWDQGVEADEEWNPVTVEPGFDETFQDPNRFIDGTTGGIPAEQKPKKKAPQPISEISPTGEQVPDEIWSQGAEVDEQWQPIPIDAGAERLNQMGTAGKLWEAGKVSW